MVSSRATSVEEYLDELPPDRRAVVAAVRDVILKNLPAGFVEAMNWGMISYQVPLERYPDTYNGQPLMLAALAAQKNHYAVYLTSPYTRPGGEEELRRAWEKAGYGLDMGKSCVRFKRLDDLPLEVVAEAIRRTPVDELIEQYESSRRK